MELSELILISVFVSFAIQALGFLFAASFKTDKVTDLSYSVTFILLAIFNISIIDDSDELPAIILNVLVILWGARLGGYLFIRINKMKRDKRFDGMRENPIRFAKFWILQGITVCIVMLPLTVASSESKEIQYNFFFITGIIITLTGIFIESIADFQKFRFYNNVSNRNKWIEQGIWKYSRHPNYFGEMLVWIGLTVSLIINVSILKVFLASISPLFIIFLLLFVSGAPLLEKKADEQFKNNPDYKNYKTRTRLIIPLPKFN